MGNNINKQIIKPALRNTIRPLKNYNVEERAMKVISRDKPTPAPPHQRMERIMKDLKNDPLLAEKSKPDLVLVKNLEGVFLRSQGNNPEIQRKASSLPQDRENPLSPEFGVVEPKIIPEGRATLRQILEFLRLHENDPENYQPYKIAEIYKLSENDVNKIIRYYKPFEIMYPEPKEEPSAIKKAILPYT